jgi:hypothetical protein
MEADQTQIDWTSNGFITGNIGTSPGDVFHVKIDK